MDPKQTLIEERKEERKHSSQAQTAPTFFSMNQVHNPTLCLDIAEAYLKTPTKLCNL